jgi:hypothetical protein
MDERLEAVDKILAENKDTDWLKELHFAMGVTEPYDNDPNTLRWLAVCAAARAAELEA